MFFLSSSSSSSPIPTMKCTVVDCLGLRRYSGGILEWKTRCSKPAQLIRRQPLQRRLAHNSMYQSSTEQSMSSTPSPSTTTPTHLYLSRARQDKRHRVRHLKSRNGCYTCKQRRVKCDEVRPICGSCSFRGESCSFPPQAPRVSDVDTEGSGRSRKAKRVQPLQPLQFHLPGLLSTDSEPEAHGKPINMADMNLLTRYMLHTSKKMSLHPNRMFIWQQIIPDMASKTEYLMYLLLALAGAHILYESDTAKLGPLSINDSQFTAFSLDNPTIHLDPHRIVEHHQRGLEGFRKALSDMSAATAENVFCGSILIVAFAFASLTIRDLHGTESEPRNGDNYEGPFTDWLHLVRGLTGVVQEHWDTLKLSRLRSMLVYSYSNDDWRYNIPSPYAPRLTDGSRMALTFAQRATHQLSMLRTYAATLSSISAATDASTTSHQNLRKTRAGQATELNQEHSDTIAKLEDTYKRILHVFRFADSGRDFSTSLDLQIDLEEAAITSWPQILSNVFIASLKPRDQVGNAEGFSYIILAHFYLVFVLFEDLWYLNLNFHREIEKIFRLIKDLNNDQLLTLMGWPMAVIAANREK